ncbi:MAG: hypothetical protein WEC75_06505 [Dehalococcoidia bacterium]
MPPREEHLSSEAEEQLALEARAQRIIARVRSNKTFMAGVRGAAEARARGEKGVPFRDLKRKNA